MTTRTNVYKLIFILVACVSAILMVAEVSLAWYMSSATTDNSDVGIKVIGTIDLDVDYDFSFYNDALSPDTIYTRNKLDTDTLATTISTTGNNNIDEVFVKVIFRTNIEQLSLYFDEDKFIDSSITVYNSDTCDNRWLLNASTTETVDDTTIYIYEYYYVGLVGSDKVTFNAGYYINNNIDNSYKQKDVIITMQVYGLQSLYGAYLEDEDWQSITDNDIFITYAESVTGY